MAFTGREFHNLGNAVLHAFELLTWHMESIFGIISRAIQVYIWPLFLKRKIHNQMTHSKMLLDDCKLL